MPKSKSKTLESDSGSLSSDSGPEDRNPPPSKKSKSGSSSAKSSAAPSGPQPKLENDEVCFPLDKNKFVKVREFKGKVYVDIREYYMAGDGDLRPGKKGISLNGPQWQKLKTLVSEIDDVLKSK